MNERIRELIAEADRKCNETRGIYDEILAELIVRECCDIVRQCRFAPDEDAIVNEIVNHFGVKE